MTSAQRPPAHASDKGLPPAWLSTLRITVPDRAEGHLERPEVTALCMPTEGRLTVLQAAGGFGKTTVLADCCRDLARRDVPTAWLTVAASDGPVVLDNYLAAAFERAGIDPLEPLRTDDADPALHHYRASLLVEAIAGYGQRAVLVLDEVEKLTHPGSARLLNFLVRNCPPNLHVAIACRELPSVLDIATGTVRLLTEKELRFSRDDIARFFGGTLSRRQLATMAADSMGWPIALHIRRSESGRPPPDRTARRFIGGWIESRLWSDLDHADREFLLDVGLLDWFDAGLLDEALDRAGSLRRLDELPGVSGLLARVRGSRGRILRLHPLIREHCAAQRRRGDPERYRTVHRRMALALARRGETVEAMRCAANADDPALVGRILAAAGGVRLWVREGPASVLVADRFLTEETLARYPGLGLVRCVVHAVGHRFEDARRSLEATAERVAGEAETEDLEFRVDRWLVQGMLAHNGCESLASDACRAVFAEARRLSALPNIDTLVRATTEYALCAEHAMKAEFDTALERGARARTGFGAHSPYMTMFLDFQLGEVAMARGRVEDALSLYRSGSRTAKASFLKDPRLAMLGDVLLRELNFERNRYTKGLSVPLAPAELYRHATTFASYAAASEMAAERMLHETGTEMALAGIEGMWEHARRKALPALARYLAALHVAVLAEDERVADAERTWHAAGFPSSGAACLDLESQNWREFEAIGCARLRLHTARGDLAAARRFGRALLATAAARGLRRVEMRVLPLLVTLERADGNPGAAAEHLSEFLALFASTDYSRSVVREREATVPALESYLGTAVDARQRFDAEKLLDTARNGGWVMAPALTPREAQVLAHLATDTDRRIAAALGLTVEGVRYHITNIFEKLGVRRRIDAVDRARAMGLV